MIILFFALLLVNSLYCIGFYKACQVELKVDDEPKHGVIEDTKMILWWVRYYSFLKLGKFWTKPVCDCPPCMASLHSIYVFWPLVIYFYGFHPIELVIYPIYVGALCATNWIVINVIEAIESYIERN